MNYLELTKEEQDILKAFESGKLGSVTNLGAEKTRLREYAVNTLKKTKNINIRIAPKDLHKLKVMAIERGLPYQTLAHSVLHQYATGRLKEKN